MKGSVYLRQDVTHARQGYNRLFQGPTWGLSRASQELARIARNRAVSHTDIQGVLSHHPRLALRMHRRGVEVIHFEKESSQAEIARFFRVALYNPKLKDKFGSLDIHLAHELPGLSYPGLMDVRSELRQLGKDDLGRIMDLLEVRSPFSLSALNFLRRTPVFILLSLGFGALGAWLFGRAGIVSEIFQIEDKAFGWSVDAVTGGLLGLGLGGLPSVISEDHFTAKQMEVTAGPVWRYLNGTHARADTVADILKMLGPGFAQGYLSSLSFGEIEKIAQTGKLDEKEIVDPALARCKDAPLNVLKDLLFKEGHEGVAKDVFERIKGALSDPELEAMLLPSYPLEIRRVAFNMLSDKLTAEWFEKESSRIINIPAILTHPNASHRARLASVKATVAREYCEKLLLGFSESMTAKDIEEIYAVLSRAGNIGAAAANREKFVPLALKHEDISASFLLSIARGEIEPEEALGRLIGRAKTENIDWRSLREAESSAVRAQAYFRDQASTVTELAGVLNEHVQKSDRVPDGTHMEEQMVPVYSGGHCWEESRQIEVQDYRDAYGTSDLDQAKELIQVRPFEEQRLILEKMKEINPELAEALSTVILLH
jgi:hypothetical protein